MSFFNLSKSVQYAIWNDWISPEDFFHFDSSICVAADRIQLEIFYSSISFKLFDTLKGNYSMLIWMYSKHCFSCKTLCLNLDKYVEEDESQLLTSIHIPALTKLLKELTYEQTNNPNMHYLDRSKFSPRLISIILNNSPHLESINLINTTPVYQRVLCTTGLPMYQILDPIILSKINNLTCHFNPLTRFQVIPVTKPPPSVIIHGNNDSICVRNIGQELRILSSIYTNLTSLTLSQTNDGIYERDIIVLINANNVLTNITIGEGITISDYLLIAITASCQQIKRIECCHFETRGYWRGKPFPPQIVGYTHSEDAFITLVQTCTRLHTIILHNNIIYTKDNDIISIKIFGFSNNNKEIISKNCDNHIKSLFDTGSFLKFISIINNYINLEIGNWNKNKLDKSEIDDLCKLITTNPTLRHLKLSIRNEDALQLLAFIPTNIKYLTILNANKIIPTIIEDKNSDTKNVLYKSLSTVQYPTVDGDGNVIKTINDLLSDLLNAGLETYTPIEFNGEELWFEEKLFDL
jgi:hypothetical protein